MKFICYIISTLLLMIWMFSIGSQTVQGKVADKSKNEIETDMNQEELHSAVMSFADSFMTTVA